MTREEFGLMYADEAVSVLGQVVGECAECCKPETDGDLCEMCGGALDVLLDFAWMTHLGRRAGGETENAT